MNEKNRVCPVEIAGVLDSIIRRVVHNPRKILEDYVKEGMTVLDMGCGPGFFSVEIAKMVGVSGHVIAADLQEGMLQKLRKKINGTEFEKRITLHKCEENKIGVSVKVDFVLAFYILHELPDQKAFFLEISSILKSESRILVVEPTFHVAKAEFIKTSNKAKEAGFELFAGPDVFFSRTVVLKKAK